MPIFTEQRPHQHERALRCLAALCRIWETLCIFLLTCIRCTSSHCGTTPSMNCALQVVIPPYEEHLPPQEAPLQSEALPQDLQQPQSWPAHPVPFAAHHFTAGHPAGSSEMTPPAQLQNQNQPWMDGELGGDLLLDIPLPEPQ